MAAMPLRFEGALEELMLTLGVKTCELVLAPTVITAGAVVDLEELLMNVRDLENIVPLNFTVDRVEGIASK